MQTRSAVVPTSRQPASLSEAVDAPTRLASNNQAGFLCFKIGGGHVTYAINVFKIQDVTQKNAYNIDRVVQSHPIVDGMISHRGQVIPVVNLAKWIDASDAVSDDKLVVCHYNRVTLALIIGGQPSIERRDWAEIEESDYLKNTGVVNNVTRTFREIGGKRQEYVIYILDVERLLEEINPGYVREGAGSLDAVQPVDEQFKKILVAEDSPTARVHVKQTLERMGIANYEIYHNGQKLLAALRAIDPNEIGMVITDLEMPEVSGFIVVREIKNDPRYRHIPVVVNTSMSGENNVREATDFGADGFIAKTSPTELAAIVSEKAIRA